MSWWLIAAANARPLVEDQGLGDPAGVLDRPDPAEIINGRIEDGYPSAVGLGAAGFTICTGSMITPRVVLTAAHCLADFPIDLAVAIGSAYVGTDAASPDADLGFTGGEVHPDYVPLVSGGTLGNHDAAVLFLAEDVPVTPVWFRTETLRRPQTVDEDVVSVGFGLDENDDANVKRSATLKVADLDPVFLLSLSSENRNGANICSGDSGGPQYHVEPDGSLIQWAIHSWGDTRCLVESGSTRTDTVSEWILEKIEAEHGTSDRCEIFDNYGDGVCQEYCDHFDPDCIDADTPAALVAAARAGGCGCATGTLPAFWLAGPLALIARRRRR